jgi:hypothetical protein
MVVVTTFASNNYRSSDVTTIASLASGHTTHWDCMPLVCHSNHSHLISFNFRLCEKKLIKKIEFYFLYIVCPKSPYTISKTFALLKARALLFRDRLFDSLIVLCFEFLFIEYL